MVYLLGSEPSASRFDSEAAYQIEVNMGFGWFKKKEWKLVATIKSPVGFSVRSVRGDYYFYLYESNTGHRRYEAKPTIEVGMNSFNEYVKRSDMYLTKIHRWLEGRHDPDIISYSEVAEEETIHALKGKSD